MGISKQACNQLLVGIMQHEEVRSRIHAPTRLIFSRRIDVNAFAGTDDQRNNFIQVNDGILQIFTVFAAKFVLAHEVMHLIYQDGDSSPEAKQIQAKFLSQVKYSAVISLLAGLKTNMALGVLIMIAFVLIIILQKHNVSQQKEYRADSGAADIVGIECAKEGLGLIDKKTAAEIDQVTPITVLRKFKAFQKLEGSRAYKHFSNWILMILDKKPMKTLLYSRPQMMVYALIGYLIHELKHIVFIIIHSYSTHPPVRNRKARLVSGYKTKRELKD
jgi:Zn-dependent protease with chaperone function